VRAGTTTHTLFMLRSNPQALLIGAARMPSAGNADCIASAKDVSGKTLFHSRYKLS